MRSFCASWNKFGAPKDNGWDFRLVTAKAGCVAILLVLVASALVQNLSSLPVGKKTPKVLSGYAHLLCQEKFLNLEDLIQSQTLKLMCVKAHPCPTLESLIYKVVSYSFCEEKNPEMWTEALWGRLCQRVGRNIQEAKGIPKQLVMWCVSIFGGRCSAWWTDSVCCLMKQNLFQLWNLWRIPPAAQYCLFFSHLLPLTSSPFFDS